MREASQQGSVEKAHLLCLAGGVAGKGTENPFPLKISKQMRLAVYSFALHCVFPSCGTPRVLVCLKHFTMWMINGDFIFLLFIFIPGERESAVKGSRL